MSSITKPKRALLAYCALADRIHDSSAGLFGALAPKFNPDYRELGGQPAHLDGAEGQRALRAHLHPGLSGVRRSDVRRSSV